MQERGKGERRRTGAYCIRTNVLNSLILKVSIAFQAPVILMEVSVNGSICLLVISLTGL